MTKVKFLDKIDHEYRSSLYLTDDMVMCDSIEEAVERCNSKFFIMNSRFRSGVILTSADSYKPEELKNELAKKDIYCREIRLNTIKTKVLTETLSIRFNHSQEEPIKFIFDYPFLYGEKRKRIVTVGSKGTAAHTHRYYAIDFDDISKDIKTRAEFLRTKVSINDIIRNGRFVCGYRYTRINKNKHDVEFLSVGEMWRIDD